MQTNAVTTSSAEMQASNNTTTTTTSSSEMQTSGSATNATTSSAEMQASNNTTTSTTSSAEMLTSGSATNATTPSAEMQASNSTKTTSTSSAEMLTSGRATNATTPSAEMQASNSTTTTSTSSAAMPTSGSTTTATTLSAEMQTDAISKKQCSINQLTKEDFNRFINKKSCDVVVPAACTAVLEWSCDKPPEQNYWDFLSDKFFNKMSTKQLKEWKIFQNQLEKTDSSSFDVSLLHKVITKVNEKEERKEWKDVAVLLKKLKNIRNPVMHEPFAGAVSESVCENNEKISIEVVKSAGKLFNKSDTEIEEKLSVISAKINEIKEHTMTNEEVLTVRVEKALLQNGIHEIKEIWDKCYTTTVLPFSKQKVCLLDVYYESSFWIKQEYQDPKDVSWNEFLIKLKSSNGSCSHILIEGDSGSGKSTLARIILHNFGGLTIYVQCNSENIKSAYQLISQQLPKTTKPFTEAHVMKALQTVPILIVVDGIDEWNEQSEAVVVELLDRYKTNELAKFLFLSRQSASNRITRTLDKFWLQYEILIIQPLQKKDQRAFLQKYIIKLGGAGEGLMSSFKKVEKFPIFYYPIYLVIFCGLFHLAKSDDKEWTNQLSIMEHITKVIEQNMADRLGNLKNAEINAEKMFSDACCLSLKALNQSKVVVDEKRMKEFKHALHDKFCTEINYDNVLSCIFTTENQFCSVTQNYTWFHTSHQEFMAAQEFLRRLQDSAIRSVSEVAYQIAEKVIDYKKEKESSKQYLNMLLFALLALHKNNDQEKFNRLVSPLSQLATLAGAKFNFWSEILYSYPTSKQAQKMLTNLPTWPVRNNQAMAFATMWLQQRKPPNLSVCQPVSEAASSPVLTELLETVAKIYEGTLHLLLRSSRHSFTPCDEALTPLKNAKCRLIFFGCISSEKAVDVLTSVSIGADFHISVPEPTQHHLAQLKQAKLLRVTVRQCSVDAASPRPLPDARDGVHLTIVKSDGAEVTAVACLVRYLGPSSGYKKVMLSKCALSDDELDELASLLQGAMLDATGAKWKVTQYNFENDRRCVVFFPDSPTDS